MVLYLYLLEKNLQENDQLKTSILLRCLSGHQNPFAACSTKTASPEMIME